MCGGGIFRLGLENPLAAPAVRRFPPNGQPSFLHARVRKSAAALNQPATAGMGSVAAEFFDLTQTSCVAAGFCVVVAGPNLWSDLR
jgi:hypothetical protein